MSSFIVKVYVAKIIDIDLSDQLTVHYVSDTYCRGVRSTSSGVTQIGLRAHTVADCTTTSEPDAAAAIVASAVGLKGNVIATRPCCQ